MPISNLSLASCIPIKNALTRLKGNYGAINSWLPLLNKYTSNTIQNVKADLSPIGTVNQQDIIDYIATSTIIHCSNSWSYLSAAVNAYLEGDYGTAVHNAYYSELRSLMSFLAIQGIGVFDKEHVIIDQHGNIHKANANNGTHMFAKIAFDEWIGEQSNMTLLLKDVRTRNNPLLDWLTTAGFSPQLSGLTASNLLKKWSIDIDLIKKEHDLRNFVSYRPQNFNFGINRQSDDLRKRLELVLGIWDICEPSRFFELFILRKTLDDLNQNQAGQRYSDEDENKIKKLLLDLGMDPIGIDREVLSFLKRKIKDPDNILLDYAATITSSNPIIENDTEPAGILSRACLLLLVVTNIVETLIKSTGTTKEELQYWHNSLGVKFGYWENGDCPELFSDLWPDIEEEIREINNWLDNQGPTPSMFSFKKDLKENISNIRQVNRSFFWQTH